MGGRRQGGVKLRGPAARFPKRFSSWVGEGEGGGPVADHRADGRGVGLPRHHAGSVWCVAEDALLRQLDCPTSGWAAPKRTDRAAGRWCRPGAREWGWAAGHRCLIRRDVCEACGARGWHDLEWRRARRWRWPPLSLLSLPLDASGIAVIAAVSNPAVGRRHRVVTPLPHLAAWIFATMGLAVIGRLRCTVPDQIIVHGIRVNFVLKRARLGQRVCNALDCKDCAPERMKRSR